MGRFPLPASAWWANYYRPPRDNMTILFKRHRDAPDQQDLAEQCRHEIVIWHNHSAFNGYSS